MRPSGATATSTGRSRKFDPGRSNGMRFVPFPAGPKVRSRSPSPCALKVAVEVRTILNKSPKLRHQVRIVVPPSRGRTEFEVTSGHAPGSPAVSEISNPGQVATLGLDRKSSARSQAGAQSGGLADPRTEHAGQSPALQKRSRFRWLPTLDAVETGAREIRLAPAGSQRARIRASAPGRCTLLRRLRFGPPIGSTLKLDWIRRG